MHSKYHDLDAASGRLWREKQESHCQLYIKYKERRSFGFSLSLSLSIAYLLEHSFRYQGSSPDRGKFFSKISIST